MNAYFALMNSQRCKRPRCMLFVHYRTSHHAHYCLMKMQVLVVAAFLSCLLLGEAKADSQQSNSTGIMDPLKVSVSWSYVMLH